MKHFYAIATTFLLLLTAGINIGCEDDYRDMVLFEGVEPIYQAGTCDNLITTLTLYISQPTEVMIGIDGGDGHYSLESSDNAIATVAFAKDVNGYPRIRVTPKTEGVTNIRVKDGSGASAMLKVQIHDGYKIYFQIQATALTLTGDISEAAWAKIQADLNPRLLMKLQSVYTLIPYDIENPYWGGGRLQARPSALTQEVMTGTYDERGEDQQSAGFCFRYNGEVHTFTTLNPFDNIDTRSSPIPSVKMYEDVTHLVSESLPAGCRVYRLEKWVISSEEPVIRE